MQDLIRVSEVQLRAKLVPTYVIMSLRGKRPPPFPPPSPQMPPPLPSCLKETPSLLPPAARPSYRRRSGGVEEVLTVLESTSN